MRGLPRRPLGGPVRTDRNGNSGSQGPAAGPAAAMEAQMKFKEFICREALIADLKKLKPSSAKGIYLKKVSVSTTMGPGLSLDQSSMNI